MDQVSSPNPQSSSFQEPHGLGQLGQAWGPSFHSYRLGLLHHGHSPLPPTPVGPSPAGRQNGARGPNGSSVPWYPALPCRPAGSRCSTHLFLLLVEVVDDDTDEKIQGEERSKDDENDEVDVHVEVVFPLGLLFVLRGRPDMGSGK